MLTTYMCWFGIWWVCFFTSIEYSMSKVLYIFVVKLCGKVSVSATFSSLRRHRTLRWPLQGQWWTKWPADRVRRPRPICSSGKCRRSRARTRRPSVGCLGDRRHRLVRPDDQTSSAASLSQILPAPQRRPDHDVNGYGAMIRSRFNGFPSARRRWTRCYSPPSAGVDALR